MLDEVWPLAREGGYPGGAKRNLDRVDSAMEWPAGASDELKIRAGRANRGDCERTPILFG